MLNKFLILVLFSYFHLNVHAQLNCKTNSFNTDIITTCFHKNGQKSTVETWDKDKRDGKIQGFDLNGKELFTYYLRTFGGHASAHLSYFSNGQVQKIEYSSAPDGGIQFYQDSRKFNENGEQIDFWKIEYPLETLTELKHFETENLKDSAQTIKKVEEPVVQYQTVFKIMNTTGKKIILHLEAQQNKFVKLNNQELTISGSQLFTIDTVKLNKKFIEQKEAYILNFSSKTKHSKRYQIILAQPNVLGDTKEYIWLVVKKSK